MLQDLLITAAVVAASYFGSHFLDELLGLEALAAQLADQLHAMAGTRPLAVKEGGR